MDLKTFDVICKCTWKIGSLIAAIYYLWIKKDPQPGDHEKGWMWLGISIAIQA